MGFRETGEVIQKQHHVSERFCDVCGVTMHDDKYPTIGIEIEWCEYKHDGDQAEWLDVCSPECLKSHAANLIDKWRASTE